VRTRWRGRRAVAMRLRQLPPLRKGVSVEPLRKVLQGPSLWASVPYSVRVKRLPYIRDGRRWRALRNRVLARDGYMCLECGSRRNLEVDHTIEPRDGGAAFPPVDGLRTLCRKCHHAKTLRVARYRRGGDPDGSEATE